MQSPLTKRIALGLLFLVLCVGVLAVFVLRSETPIPVPIEQPVQNEEVVLPPEPIPKEQTIGTSVEGRAIRAYTYGTGDTHMLFVGGIHGGYEWNSVLLAYRFIDYFKEHPESIPASVTLTIIPSLNIDGLYKIVGTEGRFTIADVKEDTKTGAGRFNAHNVDLNRNFDCKWKPESMWRSKPVSAGTAAFSEPEASALRDFVLENNPTLVIFWHSQSNAVYASECKAGILPNTRTLMNTYVQAAGYPAVDSFDAYEITGDAEGWLASINIPAITVELSTHETIEWERNLAGVEALLQSYE